MLTEEEKRQIKEELKNSVSGRAACVEALKIVQRRRGWVSGELGEIAALLEMTPDELDSIATFYSLIYRKPVGRHVILVCDSVSCWITGYDSVQECLTRILGIIPGETTEDGRFTLLPIACLGACDQGPAMMVDGELYTDLDPEKIEAVIGKYR
jgi:NADH-quinone oxidoreductase subunit E